MILTKDHSDMFISHQIKYIRMRFYTTIKLIRCAVPEPEEH